MGTAPGGVFSNKQHAVRALLYQEGSSSSSGIPAITSLISNPAPSILSRDVSGSKLQFWSPREREGGRGWVRVRTRSRIFPNLFGGVDLAFTEHSRHCMPGLNFTIEKGQPRAECASKKHWNHEPKRIHVPHRCRYLGGWGEGLWVSACKKYRRRRGPRAS